MGLSPSELERYDRQIILPGFGVEGQEKLKSARVLIAGVGGLGSPLSMYLTAAGVGRILLADRDVVSRSNLNRQVLHWEPDLGRPKVDSAAEKLAQLNPVVKIRPRPGEIDRETVLDLVQGCDLVLDAMDNFDTRHLLNRASVETGTPFIYGGIHGLTGMLSFFIPGKTGCLACLFPGPMPAEVFPVLVTTPGVIACLQATEAIKYLVGLEGLLTGRLLIYNGQEMSFHEVELSPNEDCPVCGKGREAQKG